MKQRLHHVVGYLAALVVMLLLVFGPIGIFLVGLFGVLLGPLWIALLIWFTARAALLDLWRFITARV